MGGLSWSGVGHGVARVADMFSSTRKIYHQIRHARSEHLGRIFLTRIFANQAKWISHHEGVRMPLEMNAVWKKKTVSHFTSPMKQLYHAHPDTTTKGSSLLWLIVRQRFALNKLLRNDLNNLFWCYFSSFRCFAFFLPFVWSGYKVFVINHKKKYKCIGDKNSCFCVCVLCLQCARSKMEGRPSVANSKQNTCL